MTLAAIIEERLLKHELSEEVLCKKIVDFNYDIAKFETYIMDLRLEIADCCNSQASYDPDLECDILQALTTVKSLHFLYDVKLIRKDHTKRLAQFAKRWNRIEFDVRDRNLATRSRRILGPRHRPSNVEARYFEVSEELRLFDINAAKKANEVHWQSTTTR